MKTPKRVAPLQSAKVINLMNRIYDSIFTFNPVVKSLMAAITQNTKIRFFVIEFVCIYMVNMQMISRKTNQTSFSIFRNYIQIIFSTAFFSMYVGRVFNPIQYFRLFVRKFLLLFNRSMSRFKRGFKDFFLIPFKVGFRRTGQRAKFSSTIPVILTTARNRKLLIAI